MPKWLLSNEEFFGAAFGNNCDWMPEFLFNNGIISEENATMQFIYASTDYDVPDCPFCGANDNKHYKLGNGKQWKCKKCLKVFSLTTGRYIENTNLPITHWWRFCWLIADSKIINSRAIARDLEVTQKTAWLMVKTLKDALKDRGIIMKNATIGFKDYYEVIKLLMTIKK